MRISKLHIDDEHEHPARTIAGLIEFRFKGSHVVYTEDRIDRRLIARVAHSIMYDAPAACAHVYPKGLIRARIARSYAIDHGCLQHETVKADCSMFYHANQRCEVGTWVSRPSGTDVGKDVLASSSLASSPLSQCVC